MENAIKNRYEFVILFDVENGNPNGDPDAGNQPRKDPETGIGIVTDVCIKRKIRNYIELTMEGKEGYNILIKNDRALNTKFTEAYKAEELTLKQNGKNKVDVKKAQEYMCRNYFDVRTFGAVMSTGDDQCGVVRGPVQINFAHSIDPVFVNEITITRQAITDEKKQETSNTEMGKKSYVPYGLYKTEGYVSAALAQKVTGFSEDDLQILWKSIINMFENDRSAARGKMCIRKFIIFKHSSVLGDSPSNILFDKISVKKKSEEIIPRSFSDYTVEIDKNMPSGVELIEML